MGAAHHHYSEKRGWALLMLLTADRPTLLLIWRGVAPILSRFQPIEP
jgi:hypothetical protein